MNDTKKGKKRSRSYRSHGFYQAKRALKLFGSRIIDKRTLTGRALARWRTELIEDLGGVENCSVQQLTLVDLVCRQKLLLDSIDAWLLTQNVVNKRYRTLIGVCKDRQQLADALARYLSQLGMERRRKRASLVDMLAKEPEGKEEVEEEDHTVKTTRELTGDLTGEQVEGGPIDISEEFSLERPAPPPVEGQPEPPTEPVEQKPK